MAALATLLCGIIFGVGLIVSGMTQPAKVLGFLDLFGTWDPSLAVVMAAALSVAAPGYILVGRRSRSVLDGDLQWPPKRAVNRRMLVGAALFGIGWGLVGLCPGPALSNLATLSPKVILFVAAMVCGVLVHDRWLTRTGAVDDA